jgi:hypothetical protein
MFAEHNQNYKEKPWPHAKHYLLGFCYKQVVAFSWVKQLVFIESGIILTRKICLDHG